MITQNQNDALLTAGNSALNNTGWTAYAHYCLDREKGLRKEAFKHLAGFLVETEGWTIKQKMEFVQFLLPMCEATNDAERGLLPAPLKDTLVKSTLETWCTDQQTDGNPFRWYGTYYRSEAHLLKALEIDPADDRARQILLGWWTYDLYYSVHHVPEGYIGDPSEDIRLGERAREQIRQLANPRLRDHWEKQLDKYLRVVENYVSWKVSGHPDFDTWRKENDRATDLPTA